MRLQRRQKFYFCPYRPNLIPNLRTNQTGTTSVFPSRIIIQTSDVIINKFTNRSI